MKFLVLLACIAAASAVSLYPFGGFGGYNGGDFWSQKYARNYPMIGNYYNKDLHVGQGYGFGGFGQKFGGFGGFGQKFGGFGGFGQKFGGFGGFGQKFGGFEGLGDYQNFDFNHFMGEKDITVVKRDFILFYYKYLVEIMSIIQHRFGDVLTTVDTYTVDSFTLPTRCHKLHGVMRWMMTTNVDVTKFNIHMFDTYMMCKMVDYVLFIKNYFLHFNMDIMYSDYGLIRNLYGMIGDHGYGLHKYYGDSFGQHFYGKGYGHGYGDSFGQNFYGKGYGHGYGYTPYY